MKRELVAIRKVISPERDLFASIVSGVETFPGMTDDDQRYFRNVYDHLIRIGDVVDTYRDLLTGATDVYLSTVSNRLGARDEAARGDRDRVPAAHLRDGVLRPELPVDGRATSAASATSSCWESRSKSQPS